MLSVGAQQLGALPGTERLATLVERAVVAADASGMPLFAAWRAMPLPDLSAGARTAAGLRLLREHFTGAYLLAVRAAGMTPLEAVLSGPEGRPGRWPAAGRLRTRRSGRWCVDDSGRRP